MTGKDLLIETLQQVLQKIQDAATDGLMGTPDYKQDRLKLIQQYATIGLNKQVADR